MRESDTPQIWWLRLPSAHDLCCLKAQSFLVAAASRVRVSKTKRWTIPGRGAHPGWHSAQSPEMFRLLDRLFYAARTRRFRHGYNGFLSSGSWRTKQHGAKTKMAHLILWPSRPAVCCTAWRAGFGSYRLWWKRHNQSVELHMQPNGSHRQVSHWSPSVAVLMFQWSFFFALWRSSTARVAEYTIRMQTRSVVAAAVWGRVIPRLRQTDATIARMRSIGFRVRGQVLGTMCKRSRVELQFSTNRPEWRLRRSESRR